MERGGPHKVIKKKKKNGKVGGNASFIRLDDATTTVHSPESFLREVVLDFFLRLWMPYS